MSKILRAAAVVAFTVLALSSAAWAQRSEGIHVRGHWVIDVKNTDGTPASRIEFDNALVSRGQETLAGLLMGGPSVSGWKVMLLSSTGEVHFLSTEKALENGSLVLKASHRFDSPRTLLEVSSSTCSPLDPGCSIIIPFSTAAVPSSPVIQRDQTVDIKVTISFAPAPH